LRGSYAKKGSQWRVHCPIKTHTICPSSDNARYITHACITHTCTHTHTHTHTHTCTHIHAQQRMQASAHTHTQTHARTQTHTHTHTHMCVHAITNESIPQRGLWLRLSTQYAGPLQILPVQFTSMQYLACPAHTHTYTVCTTHINRYVPQRGLWLCLSTHDADPLQALLCSALPPPPQPRCCPWQ